MSKRWRFSVRSKVWLEVKGEPVFGEGKKRLLEAIERHGSINRAAREAGVSYRRAWSYIRAMETRLGTKLVETERGGDGGGGTKLTEEARRLIRMYEGLLTGTKFFAQRYARLPNGSTEG